MFAQAKDTGNGCFKAMILKGSLLRCLLTFRGLPDYFKIYLVATKYKSGFSLKTKNKL